MKRGPLQRHHWRKLRLRILERDGYRCYRCGARATTVDHAKPLAEGGSPYDPANLRAACASCNFSTGGALGRRRQLARRGEVPSRPGERRTYPGAIDLDAR